MAASRQRRISVVGHVDPRMGVRRALAAGQHIEHLDNYLESILRDNAPSRRSVSNYDVFKPENWQSLDFMDQGKLREIARVTANSGTYTSPTLTIPKYAFALGQTDDEIRRMSGVGLDASKDPGPLSAGKRTVLEDGRLRRATEKIRGHPRPARERDQSRRWQDHIRLRCAGVVLRVWLHAAPRAREPGVGRLDTASGPRSGDDNPCCVRGHDDRVGADRAGAAPDMVLLTANPLADIRNSTKIDSVCIGGRWLERGELDRMLQRAGERVGKPAP